jgi:hypothetical protein
MLNNNSEQFPPVMSHHRPFDPTTSTGMAHTNRSTAAVNNEAKNSNHHLNPHQHNNNNNININININTAPVNPINPTTTSSPAADDTAINNITNNAINILHHFKNGIDDMMGGGVLEPLPTDVICGRGKMTSSHPANRRFRELVDFHKRAYQNSKRRDEKTRITCDLVDKLRSEGR